MALNIVLTCGHRTNKIKWPALEISKEEKSCETIEKGAKFFISFTLFSIPVYNTPNNLNVGYVILRLLQQNKIAE